MSDERCQADDQRADQPTDAHTIGVWDHPLAMPPSARDPLEAAAAPIDAPTAINLGQLAHPLDDEPLIPGQHEPAHFLGDLPAGFGVMLAYPSPHDLREYLDVRRDSRDFHLPWEPRRDIDPTGPEMFRRVVGEHNTKRSQRLFIRDADSAELLGQVSFSLVQPGPGETVYAGYWTARRHARAGVATRGLALALDHAFHNLALHRVEANVQPDNTPSIRLMHRLGFRDEGLCRKYLKINGEWRDHIRFSMLEEDWSGASERLSQ